MARLRPILQAEAVSRAASKLYTRAVLPAAILDCSSSGTPAGISARICARQNDLDRLRRIFHVITVVSFGMPDVSN